MRRRSWIPIALVLLIAAAIVAAVLLRKNSPPEVARLLPEADGLIYINLKPVRVITHFDRKPVEHEADYQAFIDATGIEVERDLDEAAFALSRRSNPAGPDGPLAYTEVFQGHFDSGRLAHYLGAIASSRENYAGTDIYVVPHQGRTVRVALLGVDIVAASNTPTPEQMHSVLDRYHTAALSFSGSTLLSAHYRDVPLLSMAWAIGRSELALAPLHDMLPADKTIPRNATIIASARYVRSLQLRIEEIAASAQAAKDSAESLKLMLNLARSLQGGADPDVQEMLKSASIDQSGTRMVLKATVPVNLIDRTFGQPGAKPPQQ